MEEKIESPDIKVSVLTPVYNVDKYLERCLMSLADQTLSGVEIIVVNDGSTDSSHEIMNWYAMQRDNFRIISKENSGYGETMNIALEAAKGKYVGILESDDFAEPDMFRLLYEAAENNQADVVLGNFYDFTDGQDVFHDNLSITNYEHAYTVYDFPKLILAQPAIWTGLYRRNFLLENDIWFNETPGASYQDIGFTLKFLFRAKRICSIPQAVLHYRRSNLTSSSNQPVGKGKCNEVEFGSVWEYLQEHTDTDPRARYMIPCREFESSRWLLEVMPREEQDEYFQSVLRDFKRMAQAGVIRKGYFPNEQHWEAVQRLLREEAPLWDEANQRITLL